MRKMKSFIFFLMLFVVIGFATISVTLSIKGNTRILSDVSDFKVYFSDVKVGGKSDFTLVKSETELEFDIELGKIGSSEVITYDVTNGSSVFDAVLTISCSQGNDYLSVVNQFDSSNLGALKTRRGTITLRKLKANINSDLDYSVSCIIEATPVERDSEVEGEAVSPVQPITISTGDLISIAGENFNVISQTEDTVTMLAQYNLGSNYRQTNIQGFNYIYLYSLSVGAGSNDFDIQQYDGHVKNYVNNYVEFLKKETGNLSLNGTLITLSELKELGCDVQDDYSATGEETCVNSIYSTWLVNGQYWYTRSYYPRLSGDVWILFNDGSLTDSMYCFEEGSDGYFIDNCGPGYGIRPVITIPIELAEKYVLKTYKIGDVIAIGDEKFNVIDDDGNMVTMLAQFNLGTDYMQTTSFNKLSFGITHGTWEFEDSSREILVKDFEGQTSNYLLEYEYYLSTLIDEAYVDTDLITLKQLQKLGCDINESYAWGGARTCQNSPYISWLGNGQAWWTRSSSSDNSKAVWLVTWNGGLTYGEDLSRNGVRPIVKIYKSTLARL